MEIKLIDNSDFMSLVELTAAMYSEIDSNITEFQAVNTLVHVINTSRDFTAVGLYNDNELVGFVTGHALSKDKFKFVGIYVNIKNTASTKALIDYSFNLIKDTGYKGWEAEATNSNISSVLEKYDAKVKHTMYQKEFN